MAQENMKQVNFQLNVSQLEEFKRAIETFNRTSQIKGDMSSVLRMLVREFIIKQDDEGG